MIGERERQRGRKKGDRWTRARYEKTENININE